MAFFDTCWYCNAGDQATTGYYAVAKRVSGAAVTAGQLVRQFTAPTVGNERVFICVVAGTTAVATDATWVVSRGATTTDGTVTWQEVTGTSAMNGDLVNTPNWASIKGLSVTAGQIIKRNNGASYQLAKFSGSDIASSEPAFSDVAGATTVSGSQTYTCLGPVTAFTGGQAPHARLANACATNWFAAGNTVYVGDNHAESQATAITIGPAGSNTTIGKILCHNRAGSYPPTSSDLRTSATISTTGAVNLTFSSGAGTGMFYVYGVSFVGGIGQSSSGNIIISTTGNNFFYFDSCIFKIASTGTSILLQLGAVSSNVFTFNNCTVGFSAVGQYIDVGTGFFTWQNTGPILVSGSSVPNNLLQSSASGRFSNITLEALDLSQITGNLVGQNFIMGNSTLIKDCQLNAATTITTPVLFGQTIQLVRSGN